MHKPLTQAQKWMLTAADAIERYGHRKGRLGCVNTGMCIRGAMFYAAGKLFDTAADQALALVAARLGFDNLGQIIDWNNAPERTAEEVIAALRKVALS